MARLPYPDPETLSPENRALLETVPPLNVFRMMAGAGASFAPFMQFISAYLNDGILDPELRELVILRVGHLCKSPYEVHQHERVARTIGLTEERLKGAAAPLPSPLFSERENLALAFAEEVATRIRASDAAFGALRPHFTDPEIIELTLIAGTYVMVSGFLETLGIELEETDIDGSGLEEIEQGVRALGKR